LNSMRKIALAKDTNLLPDLADYIIHIAYQERLEYGELEYKFPDENEKILLSTYDRDLNDNSIRKTRNVIKRFDAEWCARVLAEIPEQSLEQMLFEQGRFVTVKLEKPQLLYFDVRHLWTIFFIWCIFLCPLFLLHYYVTPQKLYRVKIPHLLKSKEYECKS